MNASEQKASQQWLWGGGAALVVGFVCIMLGLVKAGLMGVAWTEVVGLTLGLGPLLELLGSLVVGLTAPVIREALKESGDVHLAAGEFNLWLGGALWVLGWAVLAARLRGPEQDGTAPSEAVGKPLSPRLKNYKDFFWGTLAAYGFGIFFAEVVFVGAYMLLVGRGGAAGQVQGGLSPVAAFLWAFSLSMLTALAGGVLGAANSRRLSVPEATLALIYFGLPIPMVLSLMHHVSALMLSVGYRLREIVYLSSLLGDARPEMGYWLIYAALALGLVLGIAGGFVVTSTGRVELRSGYERFIAGRHVAVFRPGLLFGAFGVLMLGVVPPIIVAVWLLATEAAVEHTRIRHLGLKDPSKAAEALNDTKVRAMTPTAMMTAISVGGVGVGVMALIIVLSVMSGFEADLQKKILGSNAHGVVLKYSPEMPEYLDVMKKIAAVRGVKGQTPFILNEVMVSSEGNVSGSMIKGIDPKTVGDVTDLPENMLPGGSLEGLDKPETIRARRLAPLGGAALDEKPSTLPDIQRDPMIEQAPEKDADTTVLPGIVLGRELAQSLKVVVGDRLNVMSPVGSELGPQGPMPKSRPFRVAGIFYSGMFEYDSKFVYIHLREAQSFFGIKGASGVEIKVEDVDNARSVMKNIYDVLDGYPFRTRDWGEMNHNLFSALRLEKLVMAIILTIIVIVAAGLIVATVFMLVLEKRKEIAVLKALGVPDGGIVKIFLAEGLQIGIAGGLLGFIAGIAWCLFIEKVGLKLDAQVYYIPALPVRIELFQTALAVVIAVLVTFLASIYPALKASQVEPVDGLKAE